MLETAADGELGGVCSLLTSQRSRKYLVAHWDKTRYSPADGCSQQLPHILYNSTMIIHCSLHHLNSISSLIIDIYVLFRHSLQYNLIPLSRALYHTMGSLISAGCCDVFYAKNICYLPRYDIAHKHELIGLLNKQCHDPINHCLPFFNSWLSRIFSGYFCAWVIKLAGCRVMNGSLNWKYGILFNLSNIR